MPGFDLSMMDVVRAAQRVSDVFGTSIIAIRRAARLTNEFWATLEAGTNGE
jgi:hypothetical protein